LAAVMAALYWFPPATFPFWPPCPWRSLTGLYCPGCGNTRALSLLLHGDFAGSLRHNLLFLPALAVLGALVWRPRLVDRPAFSLTVAGVLVLFAVLRNLPFAPFSLLAPP
ncbi:MAG: DUF2752 domain-containing protein, partial [Planctomycetes bacterium]|nr:DUF2752 domain-containing protein [Planctomycetota bacterium]